MAITSLPENPNVSVSTLGKDYLLSVNTGTVAVSKWVPVAGQRNTTMNRSAEEIDCSDKTSGGWKVTLAGLRSWSMEMENVAVLDDEGAEAVDFAYNNGKELHCRLDCPNGDAYIGWGSVTECNIDTAHDDVASISATINGNGRLEKTKAGEAAE